MSLSSLNKNLISEKEAANFLNISVKTIQAWRYKGYGPTYIKFAKKIAYTVSDLQSFVESQKIHPKAK